jgi:hypothetical protein
MGHRAESEASQRLHLENQLKRRFALYVAPSSTPAPKNGRSTGLDDASNSRFTNEPVIINDEPHPPGSHAATGQRNPQTSAAASLLRSPKPGRVPQFG